MSFFLIRHRRQQRTEALKLVEFHVTEGDRLALAPHARLGLVSHRVVEGGKKFPSGVEELGSCFHVLELGRYVVDELRLALSGRVERRGVLCSQR